MNELLVVAANFLVSIHVSISSYTVHLQHSKAFGRTESHRGWASSETVFLGHCRLTLCSEGFPHQKLHLLTTQGSLSLLKDF